MQNILLRVLCGCLVCLLAGCVARRPAVSHNSDPQTVQIEALSSAPAGMRLGAAYISALNEPCYEAFVENSPSTLPQAYCQRKGVWTLLPCIYMSVPADKQVAPQRP